MKLFGSRSLPAAKMPATPEPLDRALIPWLMATAAVTLLPHTDSLPPWLPIGAGFVIAWRFWLWQKNILAGNKWLLVILACAGTAGIIAEFKTIFGREPGVGLLFLLMSLKLIELRSGRDAVVVVMLGYFLLLTHYFYADSIPVGLWMLFAMTVATATLIRLQAPHAGSPQDTLKSAASLILQAMPIMAILFVLFPRISGPLWGLPQDARKATSGLSEEMSPGSISELSQSSALAFRAEFKDKTPSKDLLYWRGPVMTDYDGRSWKVVRTGNDTPPAIISTSTPQERFEYALTLEPHQQRWLLALDMPVKIPSDAFLTPALTVIQRAPVRDRLRVEFTSATRFRTGPEDGSSNLQRALALPAQINPRSRALAQSWRQSSDNPEVIAAKALLYFQEEAFVYTLKPPLLGQNIVDDFLFTTKRGFCEHFASSFVFLMRAAGVPARVVGGYLGGEINPIDGNLTVRQSDAHAWAEIWIRGEGWRRIDPTAAVAPGRVEQGLQGSLPEGEVLPPLLRPEFDWLRNLRYRWDAIDYAWNRWVLGYDAERQRQLLNSLGVGNDWQTLIALLAGLGGVSVILLTVWVTRRQRQTDRAQALWLLACEGFARRGLPRQPAEGPADYAARIGRLSHEHAALASNIAKHYIRVRYAGVASPDRKNNPDLIALHQAVRALVPHWNYWKLWRLGLWNFAKN